MTGVQTCALPICSAVAATNERFQPTPRPNSSSAVAGTLENAVSWFVDQEMLVERDRKLVLGAGAETPEEREAFREQLRSYLGR